MNSTSPGTSPARRKFFVLVPGSWHSCGMWEPTVHRLVAAGHAAALFDRPGRGVNAAFPNSMLELRPLDRQAVAQEVSPVAWVTQEHEVAQLVSRIHGLIQGGSGPIILVAHSSSGISATAVVEQVPEMIEHVVYLAAQMPNAGVTGLQDLMSPENIESFNDISQYFLADPAVVGALRLDWHSSDPAYIEGLRRIFYGHAESAPFRAYSNLFTPDDPVQPFTVPVVKTLERWGSVRRSYIRCGLDASFLPALQDRLIAQADAFSPHNLTRVYRMESDHSPFMSRPDEFAEVLLDIASQ